MYRSHILVCGGTGCHSNNSANILKAFNEELAKAGIAADVQTVQTGCFGLCAVGPVVIVYPEGA
ncbi:MAG: (2Fe-2S) ferredoxin domain-containing protein, partial [Clostridia bacterium]|nr:(2Fe-2S) ferredoxin domain-containing protein [Clostridia bacterium]